MLLQQSPGQCLVEHHAWQIKTAGLLAPTPAIRLGALITIELERGGKLQQIALYGALVDHKALVAQDNGDLLDTLLMRVTRQRLQQMPETKQHALVLGHGLDPNQQAAILGSLWGSRMCRVGAVRRQTIPSRGSQRRLVDACNVRRLFRFNSSAISSVLQRER